MCQSALALRPAPSMIGGTISPLLADVGELGIETAGAERRHLGELERPEGAAVGDLMSSAMVWSRNTSRECSSKAERTAL